VISSTGIGTGILRAAKALSCFAQIRPIMVTMLTTRVPTLVFPSNAQISMTVWREKEK